MQERSFVGVALVIGAVAGVFLGGALNNMILGLGAGTGIGVLIGLALDWRDARRRHGRGD